MVNLFLENDAFNETEKANYTFHLTIQIYEDFPVNEIRILLMTPGFCALKNQTTSIGYYKTT
ncbi:MAG TPA: hypothetical protein PLC04_03050 [Candidatus Kapabacteria bacterium]|mgnify:CR=1 FL=1|nr:hypothetical protein [Candidatus Kapabacteria bacterium]